MAVRPVFVVSLDGRHCIRENVEFEFFSGFSDKQKKRCINSLHQHSELTEPLLCYDAFTDIEFNLQKSINCQAEAAAVYVSLSKQGLLEEALQSKDRFKEIVYRV